MVHPLEKRIADRLKLICKLEAQSDLIRAQIGQLEAEIEAYRDAHQFVLPKPEGERRTSKAKGRRHGVSDIWRWAISMASKRGSRGFSTDDIMGHSDRLGWDMKRGTVRAQCANFVKAGYIDRVSEGSFKVTVEGRHAFSLGTYEKQQGDNLDQHR